MQKKQTISTINEAKHTHMAVHGHQLRVPVCDLVIPYTALYKNIRVCLYVCVSRH